MIIGSKRIYSISEIIEMSKSGWSEDFKVYFSSAPINVKKYILALSESGGLPIDDVLFAELTAPDTSSRNTTGITAISDTDAHIQLVSPTDLTVSPSDTSNVMSVQDLHNDTSQRGFISNPAASIISNEIPSENPPIEDTVALKRKKPVSSLTFFYKPSPANNSKKKTQETNSPLLLHIFNGYDCPLCGNKLYITNIVVKFGAKSEVKFPADFCKRCAKHFISQEQLDEINPSLHNRPNFDYSIIDLEEKQNEENL